MNRSPLLAERTLTFSKDIIIFCRSEKITRTNEPLLEQLLRSATSIGANYSEANNAASKADFRSKIFIAKKEAAESEYWLELLATETIDDPERQRLLQECHYILMTLQKIVSTLNQGKQKTVKAQ